MFIKPDRCNQTSLNNQSINFLSLKEFSYVVMQIEVRILNLWLLAVRPSSVLIITPPVRPAQQCSCGGMQISASSILPYFCSRNCRAQFHSSTLMSLVILWCLQEGSWGNATAASTPPTSLKITEGKLPCNDAQQPVPLPRPHSRRVEFMSPNETWSLFAWMCWSSQKFCLEAPPPTPAVAKVVLEANILWLKTWYFLGFPETVK